MGPLQVRRDGAPVTIPGAKPRAILTMLGLHGGSVVSTETLVELLWGDDPPRTAAKALQTHISALRRTLGDGFVVTQGMGWILNVAETDASRYKRVAKMARDAAAAGDITQAAVAFEEALALWRGTPELPDSRRGIAEKTRWIEGHAALVEDRADALLATGRAAEIVGELEAAVAEAPLRERRWGQLMLALYRAGRQGEALGAYQRARSLLAEELGVDPGPELRRLEAAIVAQDAALDMPVAQHVSSVTRAVTFLLTDIEGSTVAWETDADAMAVALARHDELVEQVVTSRGGRLIKTRGEGDATFSVFERPSAAAAAAIELQDAIVHEPWALREPMRIRVALHTGEAELRDGDYFGRAVNRAARLRSLATGGQILCSGATAELVIDSLPDDVVLADLGVRQLKNLARPEHVFELRLETAEAPAETSDVPLERPSLPTVLTGPGPFVGRGPELERLVSAWQTVLGGGMHAVLIAGEPGVGKTRLAGEWSRQAYQQGAVVLYGRCDEDLGAPYQPFAEALRALVPCLGASGLRGLRGVEALLALVPGLTDVLPDLTAPPRADPDTERYALFDAVVALLELASASAPVVLILDDLHWAAKPTLLLLRHLLRFGEHARVQVVGTYRSTDLDRSHPLAAMLADLHRDSTANRLALGGLDEDDVTTYVAEAGYDDEKLARALASVTGGNPFFLIEALRHVDESGGVWDPSTLPQGVREAVSRRLSRLPAETNKALAAAAVVGSRFSLDLVERVVEQDLVDAFDEACHAGIVIEEPGGRYRFNHAIVRQSLLAELASVRRMRLHQRIAAALETQPGADDELLAELAYHYFECAWAGNAAKAVEYSRRAADQAMARLAYEGAADLYDRALHALEEIDDELPDRDDQVAELLVARCEALLAAGDVVSAADAVSKLQAATHGSARLAAWATCFDGQLSMLIHPERLDEVEVALAGAAEKLAELGDAAGEAKAHTVRAGCLARLGRIGDCEVALDDALTAARRAQEHRRVNAVLANAPLAALWGPNPVPRAGGRCLDVVRLLRITTDSPAVEATSTRCQAVLEAFRGRAAAARRMIESARRTVTELGLRHALLEVEQFAGIVELVVDDPAAAEGHLRKAYKGFRRMGLDADTAETAALLGRACLALGRDVEADELCSESERLAGHALKASIAWRTLRARLLSRREDHDEARRVAEAAVALAERTDALVDHGDACLTLAVVLGAAGDHAAARAAAERAADLYERKDAAALVEKARHILGERVRPVAPAPPEAPSVKLDNACVRAGERVVAAVNHQAWDEAEQLFSPDAFHESRRKIVGFTSDDLPPGEWPHRRVLEMGGVRASQVVIAVRGERLALARVVIGTTDVSPGAPYDEFLSVSGIDEEGRIALSVWFDVEDIDAAMAELEAAHARLEGRRPAQPEPLPIELDNACVRAGDRVTDAINREAWDEFEQLFAPDGLIESRRKIVGFGQIDVPAGEFPRVNRRVLEKVPMRVNQLVIAVRGERLALSRLVIGAGDVSPGAPQDEFLLLYGIDEDGRIVLQVWFDVDDIDAATTELDVLHARSEDQHPQTRRLQNAASSAYGRLWRYFAARDWEALADTIDPDVSDDDHRRVVNAGLRHGRDALIANLRAVADVGTTNVTPVVIATRGERLVLASVRLSSRDERPEAFYNEVLRVIEINSDERIAALAVFDLDDFDSAIAELEARYLAGEAAAHAHTWSAITKGYNAVSRRELPLTTPDWVNIDHRQGRAFAPGEMIPYIHATWDVAPESRIYIEAVHRLSDQGAVVTNAMTASSQEGFDAEWREVFLLMFEGDNINRCELFDEADLDAAIARFDELSRPAPQLENAASKASDRFLACFAARDWDAMAEMTADDFSSDDRRRVVGAGVQLGRDVDIENMRAWADVGIRNMTSDVIAIRGERLFLGRTRFLGPDQRPDAFQSEVLGIVEIDAESRVVARVVFDLDNIEAAFEELDARYLAGEAAAHPRTWSLLTAADAALDRYEIPAHTQDWVNIDHRHATAFAPGGLIAYLRAGWDFARDIKNRILAVHRLTDLGAVVTHLAHGTLQNGSDVEWREVALTTFEGNLVNRCELFDEADVDAAIARLEELSRPAPQLENAASQVTQRFLSHYAAGDWDAMSEILADDFSSDDRRGVVGAGIRHGRDAQISDMRAIADLTITNFTVTVMATRGERLVLLRARMSFLNQGPEAFVTELLSIVEIKADGRIAAIVVFDLDDFDAAVAELEARYLAGEAAAHAHTWSVIAKAYAGFNRRELSRKTPDWVNIDHRRGAAFAPGDLIAYIQAAWNDSPDTKIYIEAVHRLNNLGAVVTHAAHGISQAGFEAEWRDIFLLTVQGDLVSRSELFDQANLDIAIAKFEQFSRPARRLECAFSRVAERFSACFAARDWVAMADLFAEDLLVDDRRRTVNAGIRHGRDATIEDMWASAEVGFTEMTSVVIAIRGGRLALTRFSVRGQQPEEVAAEALHVAEIDSDERTAAIVIFDVEDLEAAIAELDGRYLAGEATPYAHTWSVIAGAYAALNRHELPATTPDWVTVDHRKETAFQPDDAIAYIRAGLDADKDRTIYIELVHRLNSHGAVVTYAAHEITSEGFEAEWRGIAVLIVEGDMINRTEVFDEADTDAALARFEQLSRPAPRLENAASQAYDRLNSYFARDWDAMAKLMAEDFSIDDRRRVVGEEGPRDRDGQMANMRAAAELGFTNVTPTVIATRGRRLILARASCSTRDQGPELALVEVLCVVEINDVNKIAVIVVFDPDDIDAAFQELETRYIAGEAGAYADTWTRVTRAYEALNRHELPQTTLDWINTDHRRLAPIADGDLHAYLRATWELSPQSSIYVETVHRLSISGAVVSHIVNGTSQQGFDAEWRTTVLVTFEGDKINRSELFDETELDTALVRFDQLQARARKLENAASRAYERFRRYFAARDWAAMAELLTADTTVDDHRRVVNAEIRRGRDVEIANMRAFAEIGATRSTATVIATRGEHLVLCRTCISTEDHQAGGFGIELLIVVETTADKRIQSRVAYDPDDIDAAFEELETRYIAGEAAAHAQTWSVIARSYSASNRRELPGMTTDSVFVDHRTTITTEAEDLAAYLPAIWDVMPDIRVHIEAVHRLSHRGAVVTHAARGTSQQGFDAEWRTINLVTVEGDLLSRVEVYDETELDTALARLEELQAHVTRLENAASRADDRFFALSRARNWPAAAEILADNSFVDDRRRVVNIGVWDGRDGVMTNLQALADAVVDVTSTAIAIRGDRLALSRICAPNRDKRQGDFGVEMLSIVEIDTEGRLAAHIMFDIDDLDAAFEELEARYLAGEAAVYARTWSAIARGYAALNQHEMPPTTKDWVNIDHRRGIAFAPGDFVEYMRATVDVASDIKGHIEAVHRLSDVGAVTTHTMRGTSQKGFDATWRETILLTVDGDLINRCEMYDEEDVDAALARFDELDRPPLTQP